MAEWIEWVEPFIGSDAVYMRVSPETAIKKARHVANLSGGYYTSDDEALEDFIAVHWAVRKVE